MQTPDTWTGPSPLAGNDPQPQLLIDNYLRLFGITILYYDHFITFGEEYMRIWRAPRSGAAILFFVNRYLALLVEIVVIAGNFSKYHSTRSCSSYSLWRQIALMATQLFVAAIQYLRVYALYGRSKRVAALMLSIAAVLLSVSVWAVTGQTSEVLLQDGCQFASSKTSAIHIAVAWEALFTFDSVIFLLTVFKTYKERLNHGLNRKMSLVSLFFRDGAVYFGVMVIAQGANVLTFYLCGPVLRGTLSTAASAISVTMMSRLMLNLHRVAANNSTDVFCTTLDPATIPTTNSSMQFTTPGGSIASALSSQEQSSDSHGHASNAAHVRSLLTVPEAVELTDLEQDKLALRTGQASPLHIV